MIRGLVFILAVATVAIALRIGESADGTIAGGSHALELFGYQVTLELGVHRSAALGRRTPPADQWQECIATVDTVFVRSLPESGGGMRR